jgi:ABC-type Fe3+ transport system permease subunit
VSRPAGAPPTPASRELPLRRTRKKLQSGQVIHQVMRQQNLSAWLYVTPLMLVLVPFFLLPTLVVLVASFFETDGFGGLLPTFTLSNYVEILTSAQTFHLYVATLKFAVLTWLFTLISTSRTNCSRSACS